MTFYRMIAGFLIMILPFAEIAVYVLAARSIGLFGVIGLTILSMMVGSVFLRLEGMNSLRELDLSLRRGELPVGPVIRGACGVTGALLMMIPGLLTSGIGLLLLLPGLRDLGAAIAETALAHQFVVPRPDTTIIETSYVVLDDSDEKNAAEPRTPML